MRKFALYFFTTLALLTLLIIFDYLRFNDKLLHIVICDVGQGDAIFIRTPEAKDILIDGGPDNKVLSCLSSHMPFWDHSLDVVILTHPHADHYLGLLSVLDRYKVEGFYTEKVELSTPTFKLFKAKLAEKKESASFLLTDDSFSDKSGVRLVTLWPEAGAIETTDQNNANLDVNGLSVIEKLTYGNFSALFTGDAGMRVGDLIKEEAGDIDLLKVPHHGSGTGMDEAFLDIVRPEIAVISVGARNKYHHPAKSILELLERHSVKTLRTDRNGEVEVVTDGKTWWYKSRK